MWQNSVVVNQNVNSADPCDTCAQAHVASAADESNVTQDAAVTITTNISQ